MYRRRLTWLLIATFLLQVVAPTIPSLPPQTALAQAPAANIVTRGKTMPSTQELLGTTTAPATSPVYVAPDPKTENGPLEGNGTFRVAATATSISTARTAAGRPYATTPVPKKKSGVGAYRLNVSGTISSNTTWTLANSPYVVTSTVTVASPAVLSIDPGVVVKFDTGTSLEIADGATLNAPGTTGSHIVFTSYKDDIGADDNGDGTATTPAAGDWGGVHYNGWLSGSTCVAALGGMSFIEARYGTSMLIACSGTTLTDAKIEKMSSYGLDITNYPASRPAIQRLTLLENKWNLKLTNVPSTDTIKDSVIMKAQRNGVIATSSAAHIETSRIEENGTDGSGYYAVTSSSGALYLLNNSIAHNWATNGDIYGVTSTGATVNASSNWWGSTTGPEVSGATDTGAGSKVSTLVTITNWLGKAYEDEHKRGNLPWAAKAGVGADVATGNFTYTDTDFSIPTIGFPMEMVRTYNNKTADTNVSDFGYGWACTYCQNLNTSDGQGAAWERADGAKSYFKKNPDNTYTGEEGVFEKLVYDSATSTYTLTSKDQTKLVFNSAGKLVKQIDTDGNETVIARNGSNQITTVTDPTSRQLTFTYTSGYISKIVDPLGRSYNYVQTTLSTKPTTTSVTKKDAALATYATCSYQFTTYVHAMTGITDCDGNTLTQTYDSTSTKRVKTQVWNGANQIRFMYGPATDPTTGLVLAANSTAVWDTRTIAHVYYYTKSNKVFEKWREKYPSGSGQWYVEDQWTFQGYLKQRHEDIEGKITNTAIDFKTGNVLSVTFPYGLTGARTTSYTYDGFNNKLTETDNLGRVTEYAYDSEQHLTTYTDALDHDTVTTYFANGLPETVTDARGKVTSFTYDAYGYPETVTNAEGETITFDYDIAGRKLWQKDPQLHQTTSTYNARDQVLTVTDPLSNVTTTVYDTKGRKTSVTDPENHTTTFTWETTKNKLWKTTDAKNGVVELTYDGNGDLWKVKDANLHTTIFTYDQFGRSTTETDPNGKIITTEYTVGGRVWKDTDPNGQLTTRTYNDLNDLSGIAYADTKTIANTFDGVGNRLTMVDWNGTYTYTFDALNRVLTAENPAGQVITYTYDEVGNIATITYPGNLTVTYTYDDANRILSVTDWDSRATNYNYDTDGRLGSFTLPNGVVTSYGYDVASRITDLDHVKSGTPIASFDYTFDNVGNRETRVSLTGTESYLYDELYRLASVTYPGSDTISYAYDATGNRTSKTRGGLTVPYTYDSADQLTNAGDGVRTYDNDGQLTKVGSHLGYTWDARQQLVQISDAPSNTTPTANAGADFTGYVNRLILLDGSASSDPEGEQLRYAWTENGSNPQTGILRGDHAAKPGFTPTVAGTYIFSLVVNDGRANSASDNITVTVNSGTPPSQSYDINPATNTSGYVVSTNPTGNSFTQNNIYTGKLSTTTYYGAAQFALPPVPQFYEVTAATLALTGKATFSNTSTDEWSVKLLPTSLDANWTSASYNSISAATPDATLTPTLVGTGTVVAGVVNSWTFTSGDRNVLQSRATGSGKLSIRTQGDTLGASSRVQWHSGSATTASQRPKLSVTYGPATITNQTPVANAGTDQTVTPGTLTTLVGGDSYDYEGAVTYAWTAASTNPETVTLSSSTAASPTFTPTKAGQYRFSLVVTDGNSVTSTADQVIVNVVKELPAHTTAFTYDGNGDRVKQTKDSVDTTYVVDSAAEHTRVLIETTGTSTIYYVYGHELLYSIDAGGPHYQHHDSLGSVVAITDTSGAVEQTYDYDVFGVLRSAAGSSDNRYTFTGEQNDSSGLVFLRARYYEPASGRFVSRDPFPATPEDSQTVGRYSYVKNNPTNSVDPSGEVPASLFQLKAWKNAYSAGKQMVNQARSFMVRHSTPPKDPPRELPPYKPSGTIPVWEIPSDAQATRAIMRTIYPSAGDGLDNAVLHARTNIFMTESYGPVVTWFGGVWNERANFLNPDPYVQETLRMDLHNNWVGIQAGWSGAPLDFSQLWYINDSGQLVPFTT